MTVRVLNIIYRRSGEALRLSYSGILLLRIALVYCLLSNVYCLSAQEERGLTREGNKYFDKQKYSDAEASYKKALEKKNNFPEAIFNLGDAMYQQGRYDDAAKQFQLAAKMLTDTMLKARSFHNLGNCSMEKKEYEEAVKAYKQALKLNPSDKDTKYNLAYANAKLKDKQQNKPDNKDQKKNDQDKKDQKDKDGKGDKDKQDQKPKKGSGKELSKEQAEKLLEALKAEEQKTQEKMQKKMAKPQEVKVEKDW
jgi:tetratricopeptide (TPR) repeat protein